MEVSSSNGLTYNIEEKALKGLFDAFGSVFTLQEIAFAYHNAGEDAELAGEFLYDKRSSTPTSSTNSSDGGASFKDLSRTSYDNSSQNQFHASGKFRSTKKKWRAVSGGTVSSVIGRDYFKYAPPANESSAATKPLKLDSKELPVSAILGEETKPKPPMDDHLHKDMEDFLFKMLGIGFQMDRKVIREVLATSSNPEGLSCQRKLQHLNTGGDSNINGGELPKQLIDINELQKEVWASLFIAPDRYEEEELPKRKVKAVRRSTAFGGVVTGPLDFIQEHKPIVLDIQIDNDSIAEEDEDVVVDGSYQALRKAVAEYRGLMKEYYKAAVDEFTKGNHTKASKLIEEGYFFHSMARKHDEESNLKIFETSARNVEPDDEMQLDLHNHGAKDAVRLLKFHLSSLAGIPTFKYLKVILETNDEDTTKGARKRLVMKLLEKESIKWIEEGTPGTILICMDEINPKSLSFSKK